MNHTLIQSSDRAACSCGHWWTKVYTSDSPEVVALHQQHAEDHADWCTRCEQVTQWNGDECANNCGKVWGHE